MRMIRIALVLVLTACVGSGERRSTPTPTAASTTPTPVATKEALAPSELTATTGPGSRGWRSVLAVPFGSGRAELAAPHGRTGSGPIAFAIDCGSVPLIWLADDARRRLVEFAARPDGSLLQVVHLPGRVEIHDLALTTCGQLYGLVKPSDGLIAAIGPGGVSAPIRLSDGRIRLAASRLFAGPAIGLHALARGAVARHRDGYRGYGIVDPGSGALTPSAGLPFGTGTSITLRREGDRRFVVTWFDRANPFATRELTIRPQSPDGSRIQGVVTVRLESVSPSDRIAALVRLRNARDPAWLLEIPADPAARLRLRPLPPGSRRLLFGSDAHLYLLVTTRTGVVILSR